MNKANEVTLQSDKLCVRIIRHAENISVVVEDLVGGRQWGPVPLLALEVHEKALRREDRLDRYRIDLLEKTADGVHVVVGDGTRSVSVGLMVRLHGGEFSVSVSPSELVESNSKLYRVFAVDLLPGLMGVGVDGTLLLPVAGGTICRPAKKPAVSDRFLIYLEQPRWELCTMLPYCAAWDEAGGLVSIATRGACEAECRVATDGQGRGQTGFAASFRRFWPDPVEEELREFRFVPMPAKVDPVHFCAKRLRRHIIEDLKAPTLKQRAEASPEVAYLLDAVVVKLFHGMQSQGLAMYEVSEGPVVFQNVMTFAEAQGALQQLRQAGIPKLYTQSVGWNTLGHDGLYPTRFPVEESLGGERAFRELLRFGHELGYQLNVHDNFQMNIPDSPDWDEDCIIQDIYGEPLLRGFWAGGPEYASWPLAFSYERMEGHMRKVKELGVQGMYYCDYMVAPLEVNYHPRHRGSRTQHMQGMTRLFETARQVFGAVSTEFGTLPGVVACDNVASVGGRHGRSDWPVTALLDEVVPVYTLALQGLTMIQANGGPTWHNAMTAIVYGQHPRDEWGIRPIKMGGIEIFNERRVQALKALHDLCIEKFGSLQLQELTKCVMSADHVVQSTFADGTEVAADFGKLELIINGKRLEKPAALL